MRTELVTVVGGSGFLGRYTVKHLADKGYRVRVLCRDTIAAAHLKPLGQVGQIAVEHADIANPESISGRLEGTDILINLVGILWESGRHTFEKVHSEGTQAVADEAKRNNIKRVIHISSLGVDRATQSNYARTKLVAEESIRKSFPEATILRPSVMFGAEDNFFNQFAGMSSISPFLPLIGGGHSRFQPVYVDDVARAIMACIENDNTKGELFELGGPEVYTFRELLDYLGQVIEKPRTFISIPFAIANVLGAVAQQLPIPPLTRDQVRLLRYDNVVSDDAKGFADLRLTPTPVEHVVPTYLSHYQNAA